MIRIKDIYISTTDIKSLKFDKEVGPTNGGYLIINYRFDDEPIKIYVSNFEEYENLADLISSVVTNGG